MAPRRPHVTRWIDEQRLWVWMPYEGGSNRAWIKQHLAGTRPVWIEGEAGTAGRWEVARTHLWKLVDALADRFGAVDVQLEFSNRSKCDTQCQGANPRTVFECECSCGGDNHGGAQGWKQWKPVGETTLIANERELHRFTIQRGQVPAHLLTSQLPLINDMLRKSVWIALSSGCHSSDGSLGVARHRVPAACVSNEPPVWRNHDRLSALVRIVN